MQPSINIAVRATRQACEELIFALDKHQPDITDYDACAKQIQYLNSLAYKTIFEALKKAYPKAYIAEQGVFEAHNTESSWHISFIQSADNYLRRIPVATLSISNRKANKIEHALVVNLITGEEFSASRGRGAELDDKKMRASTIAHINQAKLFTNLVHSHHSNIISEHLDTFLKLQKQCQTFHISGSPILDLNYVAAGKADLCIETGINKDEMSASLLIAQEAGLLTGDFSGAPLSNNSTQIIASNAKLFKETSKYLTTGNLK
jgi:myo-inositol-1(or 4)-monophosphatase